MKQITTLLLIFCFSMVYSQNESVGNVDALLSAGKYESAYKMLDKADPKNQQPDIVIAKTDLLLKYYVKSNMHQLFGLKDLNPTEDITRLREQNGSYSMIAFAPDSVLNKLIITNPANYKLRKALGNYYQDVYFNYPDSWFIPDSVIVDKFRDNYLLAYKNGVFDYKSLYGLGYAYLTDEDYKSAILYFQKSIELKKDAPESYFNLASAYLNSDQPQLALPNAQKALEMYVEPEDKVDAARMTAQIYLEMEQKNNAMAYFQKANDIQPNDYYTLMPLLGLELELDNPNYQNLTADIFSLAPDNPVVYQDLLNAYKENEKESEFMSFLENQKMNYRNNTKIQAHICFYSGVAQYELNRWVDAKINFEKARNLFQNLFQPNHSIFKVIDSYTDAIKKK